MTLKEKMVELVNNDYTKGVKKIKGLTNPQREEIEDFFDKPIEGVADEFKEIRDKSISKIMSMTGDEIGIFLLDKIIEENGSLLGEVFEDLSR